MQQNPQQFDFSGLSVDERIDLAMALWDSVHEAVEKVPLTQAQQSELRRRKEAMDNGEMEFLSWEEVEAHLHKHLGK